MRVKPKQNVLNLKTLQYTYFVIYLFVFLNILSFESAISFISNTLAWYVLLSTNLQVKEYLRKEFERHGYSPNDTLHENMVEDIFAKEDENKDGFISSREFTYKHDEL